DRGTTAGSRAWTSWGRSGRSPRRAGPAGSRGRPRSRGGAAIVADRRQIARDRGEAGRARRERGGPHARDEECEARPEARGLVRRVDVGEPALSVMGGNAGHRPANGGAAGREQGP